MILIIALAFIGNAVQYQNTFEICERSNFKDKACNVHEKMLELNPRSKFYKKK